jgi:hypothetical protein
VITHEEVADDYYLVFILSLGEHRLKRAAHEAVWGERQALPAAVSDMYHPSVCIAAVSVIAWHGEISPKVRVSESFHMLSM